VSALAGLISTSITACGTDLVERVVFGTADAIEIASALESLVTNTLETQIEEVMFYETSVGCVVGLLLRNGSEVVVKAYQPRWSDEFLLGVQRVQGVLARSGFPCPRPVAGPVHLLAGHALIEAYLPDPGPQSITEAMLGVSAAGLATQINLCRGLEGSGLRPHPMDADHDDLYPIPHSPIFDFEATAAGAEWIDQLAQAARTVRDDNVATPVVAHCDWSARNVRMDETGLLAVYDWDSLSNVAEVTAVGQAAATWSAVDGSNTAPSANEIATYVARYEEARGARFGTAERVAVGAAALYVLAYTARCEHAIDPEEAVHRRARPRLANEHDALLELPDLMAD
jgi:Phosphotransferase enzyme family